MGALKPWHIVILVAVVLLLFGAKRLPDAARSLGRSMRILKTETRGLMDDDDQPDADAQVMRQLPDTHPSPAPVRDPLDRTYDR